MLCTLVGGCDEVFCIVSLDFWEGVSRSVGLFFLVRGWARCPLHDMRCMLYGEIIAATGCNGVYEIEITQDMFNGRRSCGRQRIGVVVRSVGKVMT